MKNLVKKLSIFCCICLLLGACEDKKPTGEKPDPIVSYNITPINGGATISYTIPKDPNVLYVMAEYTRNGKVFTERSSTHVNSLTIEGFNTLDQVSANLYTVNFHEMKSDPLTVSFTPLESIVSLVSNSVRIAPDFGGIRVSFENAKENPLGVRLMVDSLGTLIDKDIIFTSLASVMHIFRGFKSVETTFALNFEDKWGNVSDMVYYTGTPIFEEEVPKPWTDMRSSIPLDNTTKPHFSPGIHTIWDNIVTIDGDSRYLSMSGSEGCSFSFDLGVVVKLSRMAMWPYLSSGEPSWADAVYREVHIMKFEMWGTPALDYDKLSDRSYWLHPYTSEQLNEPLPERTFMDDWVYLGVYEVERLDLMGASDADILERGLYGHHFNVPIECDPVRFIRFFPLCTADACPPLNNYWQVGELSFWGDTTVPQD